MQSNKRPIEIDPDYELSDSTIKRIKLKEQQEKQETEQKITNIITSQFNIELTSRQSQIETIQERIVKVRKTMHLLRYVLVKSYYNNKNCLLNATEEPSTSSSCAAPPPVIDVQSRIHPAVKRLIGKNASFNFSNTGRRRCKQERQIIKNETLTNEFEIKDGTNEFENVTADTCETVDVIETKSVVNGESCCDDSVRNRRKRKYRIVVGNISKYMPAKNKEDNSTHKWMMYVRGPKETPNVSHFIKKVVFYLHPSYKPCDVIELDKDPFHLSRRGWGEFPVRVKIFFHGTLNKPVDVIHNLKLDKTHTGRQTLGNETVVDLYLFENNTETNRAVQNALRVKDLKTKAEPVTSDASYEQNCNRDVQNVVTVNDAVIVKTEAESTTSDPSYEHDYYTSDSELPIDVTDIKSEVDDFVQLDHTYCLPESSKNSIDTNLLQHGIDQEQEELKTTEEIICDFKSDMLINGNSVFKSSAIKQLIPQLLSKDTRVKVLKIMGKDGKTVIFSKNSSDVQSTAIDVHKFKINIPVEKFKCVLEVLPFLFRRLPLVTNLADNLSYRCRYPYVAQNLNEYFSWNIGRRRSSEWRRAKTVLEYLQTAKIFGYKSWNTKLLIMYARAHAYTPSASYTLFKNVADKPLLTSYETCNQITRPALLPEPNVPINVTDLENEDVPEFELSKNSVLSKNNCGLECSFIRKVASDARVKLQPEEIAPGVLCNAAEVMIWESLKCLVNDLMRNARTHLVLRENFCEETSVISAKDVTAAINDRVEFQKIFESFNNKSHLEYYM